MIQDFKGKTAVLTGAGSGFGLECARIGARLGMNLVLVDVQADALERAEAGDLSELETLFDVLRQPYVAQPGRAVEPVVLLDPVDP